MVGSQGGVRAQTLGGVLYLSQEHIRPGRLNPSLPGTPLQLKWRAKGWPDRTVYLLLLSRCWRIIPTVRQLG